jgi:hypothetical protein
MRAPNAVYVLALALVFAAPALGATYVDAHYGFYTTSPQMNHTLRTIASFEQEDIDYWGGDQTRYDADFYHESGLRQIPGDSETFGPVPGLYTYYLVWIPYGSPIPPADVGDWTVHVLGGIRWLWCDSTSIPIQCDYYVSCNAGVSEPCHDTDNGYID